MSVYDIAADQLKCVRALSAILPDGALTMPESWHMHTFTGYEPPIVPELEGLFLASLTPPTVGELRSLLAVYADKYGLAIDEKPHGGGGKVAVHARGRWQGVDLHVWGPARPEGGA